MCGCVGEGEREREIVSTHLYIFLHKGLDFILSLELGDVAVKEQHYEDFSNVRKLTYINKPSTR